MIYISGGPHSGVLFGITNTFAQIPGLQNYFKQNEQKAFKRKIVQNECLIQIVIL